MILFPVKVVIPFAPLNSFLRSTGFCCTSFPSIGLSICFIIFYLFFSKFCLNSDLNLSHLYLPSNSFIFSLFMVRELLTFGFYFIENFVRISDTCFSLFFRFKTYCCSKVSFWSKGSPACSFLSFPFNTLISC